MGPRFGWIEWNGGKPPVTGDAEIKWLLRGERDGRWEYADAKTDARDLLGWDHNRGTMDIVAYKIIRDADGRLVNADVKEDPVALFQPNVLAVGGYPYDAGDSHEMVTFHELPVIDTMADASSRSMVGGFGLVDPSVGVAADIKTSKVANYIAGVESYEEPLQPAKHADQVAAPAADEGIVQGFGEVAAHQAKSGMEMLIEAQREAEARVFGDNVLQFPGAAAGIGDVNGTEKGSGARFNAGKTPFELVPLTLIAASYMESGDWEEMSYEQQGAVFALNYLGQFQAREGDEDLAIFNAMSVLGLEGGWVECAEVFDYGKRKYSAHNWCRGMAWSIPIACAARHLLAIIRGELTDPESGKSHRGHTFCNLAMLYTFGETYPEGDDRPAAGLFSSVPVPFELALDAAA